jgi:hypothetical protein
MTHPPKSVSPDELEALAWRTGGQIEMASDLGYLVVNGATLYVATLPKREVA